VKAIERTVELVDEPVCGRGANDLAAREDHKTERRQ
jgi:hypothetical protein